MIESGYTDYISELQRMQDRLRTIRDMLCDPKNNTNPRYHSLSSAISQISRAIADMQNEDRQ